jgi:paraquat-inducible protein B
VHQALQELTRTLQSLNALSDYLERHPEALLRGKSGD